MISYANDLFMFNLYIHEYNENVKANVEKS